MIATAGTTWESLTQLTGSSVAALITSVAALIASIAAWRRSGQGHRDLIVRDERNPPDPEDPDGDL